MVDKGRFLKNSFFYFLAITLPLTANFFLLPIYTRFIDPSEYGVLSITGSTVGVIAVLSSMGLNAFYLRNYASADDKKIFNGTIFWSLFIWNAILFFIGMLVLPIFFKLLNISVPFYPYMFLALLTQFFNSLEIIPMRTYRIKGEVKYYFVRILFKTILSISLGLTFVIALRMGVLGRYYAELINSIVFAIFFIRYMYRNSYFRINKDLLKKALHFSMPIIPSDLLQMGTPLIVNIIIERILSLSQLGIYSISVAISNIIQLVTSSISLTVEPEVYNKSNTQEFPIFYNKVKNLTIITVGIVCVGFGLFVKEIIYLILDKGYWDSWKVVQIISVSFMLLALKTNYSQLAIIQGRTKILLFSNIGYLLTTPIVSLITLSVFGASALGWPNIIGMFVSFMILYLNVDKEQFKDFKLLRDFSLIVISTAILYLSRLLDNQDIVISIVIKIIVFACYILILVRTYNIKIKQIVYELIRKNKQII